MYYSIIILILEIWEETKMYYLINMLRPTYFIIDTHALFNYYFNTDLLKNVISIKTILIQTCLILY